MGADTLALLSVIAVLLAWTVLCCALRNWHPGTGAPAPSKPKGGGRG